MSCMYSTCGLSDDLATEQVFRRRNPMSTNYRDPTNMQETPPRTPQSIFTQNTVKQEKVSRPGSFPPPQRPQHTRRWYWFTLSAVAIAVVLIFSVFAVVFSQRGTGSTNQITPTAVPGTAITTPASPGSAATPASDTAPTPVPGVIPGPQHGPPALSNTAYWDRVLGTQGTDGNVERVYFANIVGNPTLQALVTVRHRNANSTLDVYVFDQITNAKPQQLFKMASLIKGDAKISVYNSVLTAEVDRNSFVNAGKSSSQWTRDLFREFAWSQEEGTLVQVAFPGIFPDLTRYQAEADQASVNQGHQPWKNDPAQVASALAKQFLPWTRSLTATVTSGGGAHDVYATVKVQETPPQGASSYNPYIVVNLSRLEGNIHNIWIAISVSDGQMLTLENLDARSLIDNPVRLEGKGAAFEGMIGNAFILDHLYKDIGHAQVTAIPGTGMGNTRYSTMVLYRTTFQQGKEEGIVVVHEANGGISNEPFTAVMTKVLLTPEPGVASGPLPGPDQAQKASYWVPIIGIDTSKASIGTPSFANMKGNASLQALIPVYHTDQSQIADIYVYDQILSAHPVQLFKLPGLYRGGAMISGYSTIITSQVDLNSSLNKGKTGDQLTTDLFREFKWSDGAGIFVPTAFPGIFPDLTRYQAVMDQANVRAGSDAWKNDAVQVAQRMTTQLLNWSSNAPASIVSGGGSQNIDAVVQVKSPNRGGSSVNVTLSRLEGNTSNIWIVIGVTAPNGQLTITTPVKGDRLTSPTTITGKGAAFEGEIGRAFILDHLYTTIGQAQVKGSPSGMVSYSTPISFTSTFHDGTQEGIVAVFTYSYADGSIATATLQKVMLSA